jgi:nicotinate phosphoribosyltransferase
VVNGVYKLVADRSGAGEGWRGVAKASTDKETVPGAKQVFRRLHGGQMVADVIGAADEDLEGDALLVPAMRGGELVHSETLNEIRARSTAQLAALPPRLRLAGPEEHPEPYPVTYSERLLGSPA